jgi:nicotinamidase-related amidase
LAVVDSVANRDDAVLVIIDVQEGLATVMQHRERLLRQTALLVESAAIVGVPVLITRQYPKGLGDLCPELELVLASAQTDSASIHRVDKLAFDCFGEPEFVRALELTGRAQLVIAGMESHICVCQTALAALRRSHDVHVVQDACCSRDERSSDSAFSRMARAGAVVTTAESVAYELVGQAGSPEFKRLLAAVKRG